MTFFEKYKIPLLLILVPLSMWLLFKGFRNEKDPLWASTADLLHQNPLALDKATDSLRILYNGFHAQKLPEGDLLPLRRISDPYVPTMTYEKFRHYFNQVTEQKYAIVAGVTGSGNSTLVDRMANLMADSGNKIQILCAPQFDLELNKRYIGHFENNVFQKGELLKFWDNCRARPAEKFVCVIDNFDKINPETLFGPELWQRLDDPKFVVVLGKDTIPKIPDNFYLLCITHAGVGQKIEMNNEHFKRFGGQILLPPTAEELVMGLKAKRKEVERDLPKKKTTLENTDKTTPEEKSGQVPQYNDLKKEVAKLESQAAALNDTVNLQRFVYFFEKANDVISEKYGSSYQLGQWSDVRKQFQGKDFEALQTIFLNHVNSLKPPTEMRQKDFDALAYATKNDGSIANSSPVWQAAGTLAALGFASELGVAGSFALISGIVGWLYFRRRHRFIKEFTKKIYDLMDDFAARRRGYDQIVADLNVIKRDFDNLVLEQKVNYNEAAFFYGFLEDKTKLVQMAREVNEVFLKLMDVFLDDNVLTEMEHDKLNQFLESIRYKISTPQYYEYKNQIEKAYQQFGLKVN
jgi:energy-coupling factor transporter ATP-binding protein EcfA2